MAKKRKSENQARSYDKGVGRTSLKPSPEQEAALERYKSGQDMKLIAVAGSGKTTTLRLMAESTPRQKILYLAFNRSVKEEAERRFPGNVQVKTLHGLAFGHVVRKRPPLERKFRSGEGQVRPHHIAEALEVKNIALATVIRDTLTRYIRSGEEKPRKEHIPEEFRQKRAVLDQERWLELEAAILEGTQKLWERMKDPKDPFPLSHDGYVRIWVEEGASLKGWDGILVDEAQDLDPLFLSLLERHKGLLQRIYVGDPRQQIYGWRGAVNAMDRLEAPSASLTWSFRFGDALGEAVRRLTTRSTGGVVPVVGKAPWPTTVDLSQPQAPFTVLTRTNVGAIRAVIGYHDLHSGQVHVVGGVEELCWLLEDAGALKEGKERTKPHPELLGVSNWKELEELAEVSPQIKSLLELITDTNPYALASYLREIQVREEKARLIVSTAHKAKGREWDRVLLWDDFPEWWEAGEEEEPASLELDPEEENLFYVAMTRARRHLSLAKLPSVWDAIEPREELEKEAALLIPGPTHRREAASRKESLLEWSGKAALFLLELGMNAGLPEELRTRARELVQALHQVLPREDA
ncbi:UvrD-helicase domain-containing protein [Fervidobacterium sp.]